MHPYPLFSTGARGIVSKHDLVLFSTQNLSMISRLIEPPLPYPTIFRLAHYSAPAPPHLHLSTITGIIPSQNARAFAFAVGANKNNCKVFYLG